MISYPFTIETGILKKCDNRLESENVVIPSTVTIIGDEALMGCDGIIGVTISSSVTEIGYRAFRGCSKLINISMSDNITRIGWGCFQGCGKIKKVSLPNSLTEISGLLFDGCKDIEEIIIPDSVKKIGYAAFRNCESLSKISLPAGLVSIEDCAFEGCSNLKEIVLPDSITEIGERVFPEKLPRLKVREISPLIIKNISQGKVIAVTSSELKGVPSKLKPAFALGFVMEPEAYVSDERTEEYNKYLSVNARKIAGFATKHPDLLSYLCNNRLIEAKDVDSFIAEAESEGNVETKALVLEYINRIGMDSVAVAREKKLEAAEAYTESWIERQSNLSIEDGIRGMTFVISGKLQKWTARDDLLRHLHKHGATLSNVVSMKTDYFVRGNMDYNQQKCSEAEELGVPIIDESEFNNIIGYRFQDAEHIDVPAWVKRLYDGAFDDCASLKSVFIPDGITRIGEHAFPHNIDRMQVRTFTPQLSESLKGRDIKIILTESLALLPPRLRPSAVLGFVLEPDKYLSPERTEEYKKYISNNAIKLAVLSMEYRELLDYICSNGLLRAKDIDTFIAESKKSSHFENSEILTNYFNQIGHERVSAARERKKNAAAQYTVERQARLGVRKPEDGIRGLRFAIAGKLRTWDSQVDISDYLTQCGSFLDASVTMKTDYLVTDGGKGSSTKGSRAEELGVPKIDENDFYEIIGYRFKDNEHIVIPGWIKKVDAAAFKNCKSVKDLTIEPGVTEIGKSAFFSRKNLTSVTIPDTVVKIGDRAFFGCNSLEQISIPGSVKTIEASAFSACSSLVGITLSCGVKKIAGDAFSRCRKLTDIYIPESIEEIGHSAFSFCDALRKITCSENNPVFYAEGNCLIQILGKQRVLAVACNNSVVPAGVTVIRFGAFSGITDLSNIVLPDSVVRIESYAFSNCFGLESISIPKSVEKIGHGAFEGCSRLKEVTIPESIDEIRDRTFYNCRELESITIPSSVTCIARHAFDGCKRVILHVSTGSFAEQFATENNIPWLSM